jgi:hypothetical protein
MRHSPQCWSIAPSGRDFPYCQQPNRFPYYLFLDKTDPQSRAGSNFLITFQAFDCNYGFKARIPPVPAGTYRISQNVTTSKGRATVYAMITVTTS